MNDRLRQIPGGFDLDKLSRQLVHAYVTYKPVCIRLQSLFVGGLQ